MSEEIKSTLPSDFDQTVVTRNFKLIRSTFRRAEPADIADFLGRSPLQECVVLFRLLPHNRRPEVFSYIDPSRKIELIEELPEIVVTNILNGLDTDDRTKFLEEIPFEIREKILLKLSPEERSMASQLLAYPEDSVGRMMSLEFLSAPADLKISQTFDYIRWHARDHDEIHPHLFIVDSVGVYLGETSFANLVLADPQSLSLSQIMDASAVCLNIMDDEGKAVEYFRKYDKAQIPVVNDRGVLVGIVTADDVFDVAEEEATEDIQQFGGQPTLDETYFQIPMFTLFRKRAGWLAVIFLGELFTGTALRHYDEAISQMRYLVFFIPLILSSGGNSGSQSASLIIRGLAIREMSVKDWFRVFLKEIRMGLALGAVLGVLGYSRAHFWGYDYHVSVVILFSLVGVVLFGAVCGAMLPFLMKWLKLDPAVSSSPFIATLSDVTGLMIFFNVALYFSKFFAGT